jgi:hypothetical protein
MKVDFVVKLARSGELHSLSNKTVTDEVIIDYINLGIIELYKRFNISTRVEVIQTTTATPVYTVRAERLNQILVIYDCNGKELTTQSVVEDEQYDYSLLSYNTILLTNPQDEFLTVVYKAAPPIVYSVEDEIDIPYAMLEALLHYIGYRAHGSINGNINQENNTHYMRFDKSCNLLAKEGYVVEPLVDTRAVEHKGFI